MHDTHIHKRTLVHFILGIFLFLGVFILSAFIGGYDIKFKADIFSIQGSHTQNSSEDSLFIPDNYIAESGKSGDIEVKVAKNFSGSLGFSLEILFPENLFSVTDISTKGTVLEGKNFFVQKNLATPGKISIVGATGGVGVDLLQGDVLLKISGKVSDSSFNGEDIDLTFASLSLIGSDLKEKKGTGGKGKIKISSFDGSLGVDSLSATSDALEIVFSEEITKIKKSDITLIPNGITENSLLNISGKTVTISRLHLEEGGEYTAYLSENITGNGEKKLSEGNKKIPFLVKKSSTPDFSITSSVPVSDTLLRIGFSEPVNEASLSLEDFSAQGLTFTKFELSSDKKTITLTVADDTPLFSIPAPVLLQISAENGVGPQSATGKFLHVNLVDIFKYHQEGPLLLTVKKIDDSTLDFEFLNPLRSASIKKEYFALHDTKNFGQNFISDSATLTPTADFKTIRVSNLELETGKVYMATVLGDSVEDEKQRTTSFTQVKIVGMGTDKNYSSAFGIDSVTPLSPNHLEVIFTEVPQDASLLALNFSLRFGEKKITIYRLERDTSNTKKIHLFTEKLEIGKVYSLFAYSDKWRNIAGKFLGGKNSILFTGTQEILPKILRVEPSRFTAGEVQELHIYGENLPNSGAKIESENILFDIVSVESDGSQMLVKIPNTLEAKMYSIRLTDENGKISEVSDAFLIEEKEKFLSVLSDESYSSPRKIPNDGTTTAKLFVRVDDPKGLADIDSVHVDMRKLDGDAGVKLTAGEIVDGKQYFVLDEFTVPNTVATSKTPYEIPVTMHNKKGDYNLGTVQVWVSKDITSSIAPEIKKSFAEPSQVVSEDQENPLRFFVDVLDEDGGDDIQTVAVELGQIGGETILLTPKNDGNEHSKTRFFESLDGFVVPGRVQNGTYSLPVTVIDQNGDQGKGSVSVTIGESSSDRPIIDTENFYISPQKNIIRDGKYEFKIHVKVSDPSGTNDIDSVTANLEDLGFGPLSLDQGVKEGKSQWYSSPVMILPKSVSFGSHSVPITVTDLAGNSETKNISVTVVDTLSTGIAPYIASEKGYSTPASIIPDGKTPFSAYIFVEDADNDISHVVLHLKNYAKFIGETLPEGTSALDKYGIEQCISTRTILCLKPILKEGNGQWFYINSLIVPDTVAGSSESYHLPVVAVDTEGHTSQSYFELFVGDSASFQTREKPYFKIINPLSSTQIQLLLSSNIDPEKIKKEYFSLSLTADRDEKVTLYNVKVSPDGKLVTLETSPLQERQAYSIQIDAEKMGLRSEKLSDKSLSFIGFAESSGNKSLRSTGVKATSPKTFSISFNQPLDFLSAMSTENFEVFDVESGEKLDIVSSEMIDERTIEIRTAEQKLGAEYDVYFKNIHSVSGEAIIFKQSKSADAFALSLSESLVELHHRADFNNDNTIDFKDFTMFAAVYGKTTSELGQGDFNSDKKVDFSDFTLFSSQYNQPTPVSGDSATNGALLSPSASTNAGGNTSGSTLYDQTASTFDSYSDAIGNAANSYNAPNYGFHGAPAEQTPRPSRTPRPTSTPWIQTQKTPTPTASEESVIPTSTPSISSPPNSSPTATPNINTSSRNLYLEQTPEPTPIPSESPAAKSDPLGILLLKGN